MTYIPGGGGGGAPTSATYITQVPEAGLSAEQALSALATGVLKVTTGTGVVSIGAKADIGLGNVDNTSDANKPVSTAQQTALDLKAPIASPTFTGTVSGVTKGMVGLGNVVNADTTTTANITDATNKRFVTDAQLVVIGNTSGTNTGDQTISDATISTSDITTNNVSTAKHGFAPKGDGDTAKFLNANGTYSTPAGGSGITQGQAYTTSRGYCLM